MVNFLTLSLSSGFENSQPSVEEVHTSDAASAALAFRLQQEEVASHYETFSRLDVQAEEPVQLPTRRGLRLRSINVPTPKRPDQVYQQPSPQRPLSMAWQLIQTTMPNYIPATVTPGPSVGYEHRSLEILLGSLENLSARRALVLKMLEKHFARISLGSIGARKNLCSSSLGSIFLCSKCSNYARFET